MKNTPAKSSSAVKCYLKSNVSFLFVIGFFVLFCFVLFLIVVDFVIH